MRHELAIGGLVTSPASTKSESKSTDVQSEY